MALTKEQKQAQVKELTEKMSAASSLILANYIGLNVAEVSELRGQLKESDAEMKVAKKTLMKIAAKDAGIENFADAEFEGPVSIIFSFGDPLSGAQTAFKFSKNHKQVEIIGGMFDGKILTREQALELAQMPSRDVLLATFVCMIRSPLVSFAGMCNSPLTGFARALSELSKKGGVAPEAAAPVAEAPATAAPSEVPATEEAEAPTTADESAPSTEAAETETSDSEKSES
ncbi:50S ribosomal protein L10 [Candidatus Peregrinibacteria bacterium CG10_big_fil_rev_8_21_14_0_10_49_24]|nr:MAG: 50S ribosomal protein L10 [Candidatus Peregrinibacteria bacterium CG11_big_fil_rev_8_21_14_0_20_49_14]PIR50870.1 MAG: 50S ribosomal protein L10 [Candidatus Peregrinibacteria bacterium CG10_big_fil_rev_8_21_14_0_10_49_24]PJA67147.1 MAG: 50S ribosomal protein L10 [Candidatus Peregrinibacteria bacterium CG_4_9_14_3_um_filter_49_12]